MDILPTLAAHTSGDVSGLTLDGIDITTVIQDPESPVLINNNNTPNANLCSTSVPFISENRNYVMHLNNKVS